MEINLVAFNCLLCEIKTLHKVTEVPGCWEIPPRAALGVIYGEIPGTLWGDPLGESPGGSQGVTFVTFSFGF